MILKLLIIQSILFTEALAFNGVSTPRSAIATKKSNSLFPQPREMRIATQRTPSSLTAAAAALNPSRAKNTDGGFLAFKTKYGYLNPFAIYYGVTSILLGIPWFIALNLCQLLYAITGNRADKFKRLPTFFSQLWGETLMKLTRSTPVIEGKEILQKLKRE